MGRPSAKALPEAWERLRDLVRSRELSTEAWITLSVVAAAVVFTLVQLQPSLLVADTTPSGGDMGAHVWGPDYLRHHLLPQGRITGWAPAWYAGFPAYFFYFPLPALLIVALSFVLPYVVAFKLVTVLGMLSLPIAAWAFGRLIEMRFPGPALLAAATVPFLFDRGYTIYGGNIASTLAGEFAFSISLSLALLFLGFFARGLETGRHRALTAVLLGLTGLSHLLPTLFALAGAGLLLLLRPQPPRWKLGLTVLGVGGLLAAFWSFPFLVRLPYTNNMGWEKITEYWDNLFPQNLRWLALMAAVGAVTSVVNRRRAGLLITGLAVIAGSTFVLAPPGRLWNARALPFWFLCLYLLAGVAVAEVARIIGRRLADQRPNAPARVNMAAAVAGALAVWMFVGLPLHVLPSWLPIRDTTDSSFIPAWARWNYSGYERKDAYPEYKGIVDTMRRVGREVGCGRAHWEYESDQNRFGTPMALMLLPYWTDQCIGSMEGLYFESAATTPYHFLSAAQLSKAPSNPQRGLPYKSFDVDSGVRDLQLFGARYYLAFSPDAVAQATANPQLREVAVTGRWHVFEVAGSELVTPLPFEPAVLEGVGDQHEGWLEASVKWFNDPARREVPLAMGGPKEWPRVKVTEVDAEPAGGQPAPIGSGVEIQPAPFEAVTPTQVRNIKAGETSLSFDVDRPGSPVLVKASYFPNWKASGAKGPWRITPNLMVVVPTDTHVSMRFGYTPVDVLGWLLTITGIGLVVLLARRGRVNFGDRPPAPAREAVAPEPAPAPATVVVSDDDFEAVTAGRSPPSG
ncbi:MAG TPA: 6-pyruvoyl-tetrahydropterin synthase-related protein [Acidimicrobiales bacterium]|nr:6-pyruvoyl-tetrahydropterin synthase-related protein [Acidimicrobiales bacterium]